MSPTYCIPATLSSSLCDTIVINVAIIAMMPLWCILSKLAYILHYEFRYIVCRNYSSDFSSISRRLKMAYALFCLSGIFLHSYHRFGWHLTFFSFLEWRFLLAVLPLLAAQTTGSNWISEGLWKVVYGSQLLYTYLGAWHHKNSLLLAKYDHCDWAGVRAKKQFACILSTALKTKHFWFQCDIFEPIWWQPFELVLI